MAGPGFLNLFLSDTWYRQALAAIIAAGDGFGAGGAEPPERILLEFVSANPTGPLNAANARHAAYGDALGRILERRGHTVWREYYFNDAGNQIRLLGESVRARARGEEVPEGGYQGEYIAELAAEIPGVADMPVYEVAAQAVELMLGRVKATLERYGVRYDQFFSERALHAGSPSALERTLEWLRERGHIYRIGGRRVAAYHHLRGRQGPGGDPVQRRAHLPGRRHRLSRGEARARLRAPADARRL